MDSWTARYFVEQELTRSATARRLGIDNTPSAEARANLQALVRNVLDPLREALGAPLEVSSGYRSPALNKAVGGASGSHHQSGRAADVWSRHATAEELMRLAVRRNLPFDHAIIYASSGHLHLDHNPEGPNRRRLLLRRADGTYHPLAPQALT